MDDNFVESVEQFTALLSVPAGQRRVGLGADTATVEITDTDGKFLLQLRLSCDLYQAFVCLPLQLYWL